MPADLIRAVLLIPAEGDPHGLLADGLCGARPPTAWRRPSGVWLPHDALTRTTLGRGWAVEVATAEEWPQALVLARDGAPVREGVARASWTMEGLLEWEPDEEIGHYSPWECDDVESVLYRADHLVAWLGGSVVCLDAFQPKEAP